MESSAKKASFLAEVIRELKLEATEVYRVRFEDAARALFAGDAATFNRLVQAWPKDIRDHATRLAAAALKTENDAA